jgi:tetratricopeptide (TPR) repeat protein
MRAALARARAQAERRRAAAIWLRDPETALATLRTRRPLDPPLDGPSLSLLAWLELVTARNVEAAERAARMALATGDATTFATCALGEVLLRRGDYDEAIAVLREAAERFSDIPWCRLTLADALVEAGRASEAEEILEPAAQHPDLRRHAVKRLSQLALERGDSAAARHWFSELIGLAPDYLVYASDWVTLGQLQLEAGEPDEAVHTWRRGAEIYPRNAQLRALLTEHGEGVAPPDREPKIKAIDEREAGVQRIPVRTPMITLRTDLAALLDERTAGVRQPGDVIALAESPAAAAEGRVVPLELIHAEPLAKLLSRFVGSIGPLHSHEGMQGAILVAGRTRVLAGALAGAIGRAAGRRGWFYHVAGRQTAMIDDVAAALPPHDHHMLFGPGQPDRMATELAAALDCDVAIVDANHLTGAWVIGASPNVDREWLQQMLMDNPAGNEDERTPVVIVRRTDPASRADRATHAHRA